MSAEPPAVPWKGAWAGAWTVLYGGATLLSGLLAWAVLATALRGAETLATAFEYRGRSNADLDVATRMAAVLRSAPDVVGGGAFAWTWAGVAISAAAVAGGLALTRPSETARRACVVLVAASAAHSVAAALWSGAVLLPRVQTWMASFVELQQELVGRRRAAGTFRAIAVLTEAHGVGQVGIQLVHLCLVGLLLRRLLGAHARAWTASGIPRIAPSPVRR